MLGEASHHRQQHQYAPASVGGLRPSMAVAAQRDSSSRSEPIGGVTQRAHLFTPSQPPPSTIKRRSKSSSSSPSLSPPHHFSSSSRDFAPTSSVIRSTSSNSRSPPSGLQHFPPHAALTALLKCHSCDDARLISNLSCPMSRNMLCRRVAPSCSCKRDPP
jgi:hypothetical protein